MAKDGNIVDLKHNWPKEQLVQKANYNWKSINKRIQKLETDIKSGVYMKNYSNNQNGNSNNSTISNVQSTTNYNDESGYDSQGTKNPNIEAVKNAVAEVETMADEAISATDDIIKLRTAIMAYKKIKSFIFNIEQGLMKTTNITEWQRWSEHKQEQLICLAGHLAKGIEEAKLEKEDIEALAKSLEEPVENINIVEKKLKKKNKK